MRLHSPNDKCQICGGVPSATWWPTSNGTEPLHVCPDCARSALPALAADGAAFEHPDQTVAEMEAAFWRATWCNARRMVEQLRQHQPAVPTRPQIVILRRPPSCN
jgi:hypothetical protein